MNDYTDLLYLVGAIVIFSMLSMQVNRLIFRNNVTQMQSGIEFHAVTHAQDYADQLQWIRTEDDLDNFIASFPRTDDVIYSIEDSSATLPFLVDVQVSDTTLAGSNVSNKLIRIFMNSQFLENQDISLVQPSRTISLEIIKSF
ncbi:MAG: hypothetical protein ACFCU6_07280 [Balneolaceae bacterium]